ncbi:MAG: phosphopyruvate hydratase [Actinomycetales bacterium]|nr:phosphopyruvate hydratase [Actinomycetales bacterium]
MTRGAGLIADCHLWQALDSRGDPTVAATIEIGSASGTALAPAGASAGSHEALFLRDGGSAYGGRAVADHIARVQERVRAAVIGVDAADPWAVDGALRALDGDDRLADIGGHVGTAVSIAAWLAAASAQGVAPWQLLVGATARPPTLPLPMVNIVSGGAHAAGIIDIQDVLCVPVGAGSFAEAIEWCSRVRAGTRAVLAEAGFATALIADEGGLAAPFASDDDAIAAVVEGIARAGLQPGSDVAVALDVAATECFAGGQYRMAGQRVSSPEFVDRIRQWRQRYPLVSIEDGAAEDDDEGWALLAELRPETQVLGDDRYVTSPQRVLRGIERGEANAVLIKPNQAGTLARALDAIVAASGAGWASVVSARSGETEETWLADLAVGTGAGQIKVGSTMRSERTAKWNRLLWLEQTAGLPYAGRAALARG